MSRGLTAVLLLAVCCAARADEPDACPPSAPVDDAALRRTLEEGLARLALQEGAVPVAALREQLGRAGFRITLPAPGEAVLSAPEIYAAAREAVLLVGSRYRCNRCPNMHTSAATGFFVTPGGVMATNYHVVAGRPGKEATGGLAVLTAQGEVLPVIEVLAADRAADVALLQVDTGGREVPCLPLRAGAPVGTGVWIIGHSDSNYYLFTDGMVARRALVDRGTGSAVPWVQVTAEYAHGASGAPVLDATGAVVAIVSRTDSVYYEEAQNVQRNLQMVLRFCAPSEAVAALVAAPEPDAPPCLPPPSEEPPAAPDDPG